MSRHFKQARRAHTGANARGDDDVFDSAAFPFDQGVTDEPGSGHAIGMPDGDTAAIYVVFFRVYAQKVSAVEDLTGERFVQFP